MNLHLEENSSEGGRRKEKKEGGEGGEKGQGKHGERGIEGKREERRAGHMGVGMCGRGDQ